LKAYYLWQGREWTVNWLKEEQKILATLSADSVRAIINWKPVGRNQTRVCALALTALDTGLRLNELLGLTRQNVNQLHASGQRKGH